MRYDVKIYDGDEEKETIRGLTKAQMITICLLLSRLGVKHSVKEVPA